MSMQMPNAFSFRWRSWFGLATILFLLYGAVNVFFAIFVPTSLHQGGAGAAGGLIVGTEADSKVLGRSLATVAQDDPGLSAYLVSFMDTMCMMMMAFALLQLGVAWFGLRRGQMWALWTLAIADLSFIPYAAAYAGVFSRFGVPVGETVTSFGGFFIIVTLGILVATALGWRGLRQAPAQV